MYDRAETRAANDRLWQGIRNALGEGPPMLIRGGDPWALWQDPDLLLSQTCGYPYRARLHGRVALVGTPDYGLPDCPEGHYCSTFVVRREDPRDRPAAFAGARLAYNDPLSQSGWAAPQNFAREAGFSFGGTLQTGSHAASAAAVAEGRADIAALDALSWKMMQRHDTVTASLREIGNTPPTPALPYITSISRDPSPIFDAVAAAVAALDPEDRETLSIRGIVRIPPESYLAVPNPPPPAAG